MNEVSFSLHKLYAQAYEPLICAIAFSLPLYILGIPLGGFDFTLLVVLVLVLDGLILLHGQFVVQSTVAIAMLVGWCLLTAFGRHPPGSYLVSLVGFSAFLFPFCGPVPENVRPHRVMKWLVYGLLITFVFAGYEVVINVVGLPPLETLFPYGVWADVRAGEYLGFRRVKSTFVEPARYAHYLVLSYAILDLAGRKGFEVPYRRRLLAAILITLVCTLSLSGIIIMGGYFGALLLMNARKWLTAPLRSGRFWKMTLLVWTPLIVGGGVLYGDVVVDVVQLFRGRLEEVIAVLQFGILTGSEGSRVQSTLIMFDYLFTQDWMHILIGEGYSNAEVWLRNNFAFLGEERASFARGDLHNMFSTITLSTGLVGLGLYVSFLCTIFRQKTRSVPILFVAVVFIIHFATGYLLYARLWMMILIAQIIFGRSPQERISSDDSPDSS
ncbi:MAG: hypothetical protein ABEK75_12495 [Salinibacter sp.]